MSEEVIEYLPLLLWLVMIVIVLKTVLMCNVVMCTGLMYPLEKFHVALCLWLLLLLLPVALPVEADLLK